MKAAFFAAAAALAGSALADGHLRRHAHEAIHNRRAVDAMSSSALPVGTAVDTCGCTTKVITYYGSPTLVPVSVAPTTTSQCTTTTQMTSYTTVTVEVSPTPSMPSSGHSTSAGAVGTTSSESTSSSSTMESPSTASTQAPVSNSVANVLALSAGGSRYGMTYTPYTNSSGCKSASQIEADFATIAQKGFSVVRLYSTDCNILEYAGVAASAHGLKLILGVWISNSGISAAQGQVDAIVQWAQWDIVDLIVVGNEAVSSNFVTAVELSSFISSCKTSFKNANYNGPVTTTEPLNIWQEYGSEYFCGVVDIAGANLHPFFNAQTTASNAGTFIEEELKSLAQICPGLDTINLETGWPSAGQANGLAVPSLANQFTALTSIQQTVGSKCVVLSFENDFWKSPGAFECEQYWGSIWVYDTVN